ncbi:MAG: PTS sugar transporter subunit IIC [Solobacterium sp.]|nr:PTS sugar transporter subunit IIC [Solobacterium sp.]
MSEAKVSFMDKLQDWMMEKVLPVANTLSNQRHLASVRDAMTLLIPLTIVGGFAVLLVQPPITEGSTNGFLLAWQAMATGPIGAALWPVYFLTMGCLSIYVCAGVAHFLAKRYELNTITSVISALAVFIIISGAFDMAAGSLNYSYFGASYMFGAILVAIISVEVTNFFMKRDIKIKMPDSVPPNVTAPFEALIPFGATVIGMLVIDGLIKNVTGAGFTSLVFTIFQPLMRATGSIPSVLLINFIITFFWFFGIHGDNMVAPVTNPITTAALAVNAEAYASGGTVPYVYAGAAATVFGQWCFFFCLQILMMFFCKSSRLKNLVKVSIVPSMFNINEPGVFGIPTVLNVFLFIPGAICSMLNFLIYALAANAGLVRKFMVAAPWTTPGPLNAFLATGFDFRAIILWLIIFALDIAITLPFMRSYDKQLLAEETAEAD